jgi:nuclear transport factor 2 (NTF2) superfamily protein
MARREASIDDVRIGENDRRIVGTRPEGDTTEIPLR